MFFSRRECVGVSFKIELIIIMITIAKDILYDYKTNTENDYFFVFSKRRE